MGQTERTTFLTQGDLTSHSYNRATAVEIASHIRSSYLDCFRQLRTSLEQRQP